jgi:hypothetical protein
MLKIYHFRKFKNIVNKIKIGNNNSVFFVWLVSGIKAIRPVTETACEHKRKYIQ